MQRSNDSYLTSVVKSRFVTAQKFNPIHVKVITEAGTVYLMGMVTKREADDATQIARTTSGVKRVVRVFEYIPDPPPAPPKPAPAEPAKLSRFNGVCQSRCIGLGNRWRYRVRRHGSRTPASLPEHSGSGAFTLAARR